MITWKAIFSALIAGIITAAALNIGGCFPASSEHEQIKQHLVRTIFIDPEYEKGIPE